MENQFEKQKEFQELLKNDVTTQQFKNDMFLALIAEVIEAMNETKWKPWKKQQEFNSNKYVDELVDIQIFLFNLVISSDIEFKEFEKLIELKQEKNFKRIENGY